MSGRGGFASFGRGRGRGFPSERAASPPPPKELTTRETFGSEPRRGSFRNLQPVRFFRTRPETAENSKEGESGRKVMLSANYFKMIKKPNFVFTLYRVDFYPDTDILGLRKKLIFEQKDILGGYLYDGQNSLYLTKTLDEKVMTFECSDNEGKKYQMVIKKTETSFEMTDASVTQVLNVILRRTMDELKMQLVGRNLYDPNNKVDLKDFKVELWPGYITSIRQHENDILVCCEVSHKVMRIETAYDLMRNAEKNDKDDWKDSFKKEIIGATVLTDYNNKTYRIDDVDFSSSPSTKFKKGEKEITIAEYYLEKYGRKIRDEHQPLLVSKPKASDVRGGRTEVSFYFKN